jgi:hypothetical protein
MLRKLWIFIGIVVALVALWTLFTLTWSYSAGERAGYVQKFSEKGWICKTWEGEMAMVSMPGTVAEKFYFTVHDIAEKISARWATASACTTKRSAFDHLLRRDATSSAGSSRRRNPLGA